MPTTVKFNVEIIKQNLIKDQLDNIEIERYIDFVQDKNNSNFKKYTLIRDGKIQSQSIEPKTGFYFVFNPDEFSLTMSYQLEFDFV